MNKFPILTYLAQVQNYSLFPAIHPLVLPLYFVSTAHHFSHTKSMIKHMLSRKDAAILGIVHAAAFNVQNPNMVELSPEYVNWLKTQTRESLRDLFFSSRLPVKDGK